MALFQLMRGRAEALLSRAFHDGWVWLATDTGDLYIDAVDPDNHEKRIHVNAKDATPTSGSANAVSSGGVYNALSYKAPVNSPAFTGVPTAPTAEVGTNTTQVATTEFVKSAIDKAITDNIYDGETETIGD